MCGSLCPAGLQYTCIPNRGEFWPDSVISVGEGRVKGGGLGLRKGRKE